MWREGARPPRREALELVVVWNGAVRQLAAPPVAPAPPRPDRLEKICAGCGAAFRIKPSEVDRRHHCRRACVSRLVWKDCPGCGQAFSRPSKKRRQIYCSKRCQGRVLTTRRGYSRNAASGRLGGLKSAAARKRAA